MTWRFFSLALLAALLLQGCGKKQKEGFVYRYPGYYYRLLSFGTDSFGYRPQHIAWLGAAFKTQSDSVFWDSYNNLNDRFFMSIDSATADNFIRSCASGLAIDDSVCLLIKTGDFFLQQFGTDSIPFFSKNDSVVKVDLKLRQVLSPAEFAQLGSDLRRAENNQIENFFDSPQGFEAARDALGFYWLSQPAPSLLPAIEEGDLVTMAYRGYFLNGRPFEHSAANFEYVYGTPDQVLKGLNYVTGRLKLGQTAKILLPSRLAFGESGSSNGIVPPFTPLIYELKIIDVKKIQ